MAEQQWRLALLSWALTVVSRALMLRDRLLGVPGRAERELRAERFFFASGGRRLAGVVAAGDEAPLRLLICHGIGETVEHWAAVQAFLLARGVGSMVFNYSGYGASTGAVTAAHCEEDLGAAYAEVRRRVGERAQVWVLGFSLGSGVAASGIAGLRPAAKGLFLCEAFSSLREAAHAAGWPAVLGWAVANVWDTAEAVKTVGVSVCVVHSDADRLFPVAMARRIVEACGALGELVIVQGLAHDEPYRAPTDAYWQPIVDRVLRGS